MELEEKLEEKYGYLGIDTRQDNVESAEKIEICGYPGDKNLYTMWHSYGKYQQARQNFITYKVPTSTGQSGSPIIKREDGKEFIIGVHLGSKEKSTKNIGIRLTK